MFHLVSQLVTCIELFLGFVSLVLVNNLCVEIDACH